MSLEFINKYESTYPELVTSLVQIKKSVNQLSSQIVDDQKSGKGLKHIQSLRNRIYANISRLKDKTQVIKLKEILANKDKQR